MLSAVEALELKESSLKLSCNRFSGYGRTPSVPISVCTNTVHERSSAVTSFPNRLRRLPSHETPSHSRMYMMAYLMEEHVAKAGRSRQWYPATVRNADHQIVCIQLNPSGPSTVRWVIPAQNTFLSNTSLTRRHFADSVSSWRSILVRENNRIQTIRVFRGNTRQQSGYETKHVSRRRELVVEFANRNTAPLFRHGFVRTHQRWILARRSPISNTISLCRTH